MSQEPPAAADIGAGGEAIAAPSQTSVEGGRGPGASRSIAWSMGGQIATTLASLVSTVVLARILTPTDFGTFAFAATIYALVQWLLQVGMGNYLLREAEVTQAKIDGATALALIQGAIGTLIVLVLAPLAGWFSHSAAIGWVTAAVAVIPLLSAPEMMIDALWLRDGRYAQVALLQVLKSGLQSLVSILAQLWLGWGVWALVAGLLVNALAAFLISSASLMGRYRARARIAPELRGTLLQFGGRTFALTFAQILSIRVPDLLLGRLVGVATLGHYSRATNAIEMFLRTSSAAVTRATAPRFYRDANGGKPLPEAVAWYANILLFFVAPAMAGMAVLARPVIHLIYGPQWGIAGQALAFLCVASAIESARTGANEVLLVRDRLGLNARLEFIRAAYTIGLVVALAPFGLTAILWGKVAESLISSVLYLIVMRRLGAHSMRQWPRLFGLNALLALAAAAPPAVLMHHWGWPESLDFLGFAVAVGSGVALWLIVLALVGHPFFHKGLALLRRRLG